MSVMDGDPLGHHAAERQAAQVKRGEAGHIGQLHDVHCEGCQRVVTRRRVRCAVSTGVDDKNAVGVGQCLNLWLPLRVRGAQ